MHVFVTCLRDAAAPTTCIAILQTVCLHIQLIVCDVAESELGCWTSVIRDVDTFDEVTERSVLCVMSVRIERRPDDGKSELP